MVVPVAVGRELGRDRRLFHEYRVRARAEQAYFRLQENRIAELVSARHDLDRAAAEPCDVIDAGLDDFVGRADEVGILRTDGDGEPLSPVGLTGGVAGRGAGVGDWRAVVGKGDARNDHYRDDQKLSHRMASRTNGFDTQPISRARACREFISPKLGPGRTLKCFQVVPTSSVATNPTSGGSALMS